MVCLREWVEGPSRQCSGRLRASWASWGWVSLPPLWVDGRIRPSLTAQCWGPDCYTGTVWRWAMALQFISCCSSATKAPSAHFSSVGALRKMDWLAGPSEEAKRVAKSLCSTWLLSYASLMKDIHKQSLGSFLCIRCLKVAYTLEQAKVWKRHTLAWAIHHLSFTFMVYFEYDVQLWLSLGLKLRCFLKSVSVP